jgi:hypothetical protein
MLGFRLIETPWSRQSASGDRKGTTEQAEQPRGFPDNLRRELETEDFFYFFSP